MILDLGPVVLDVDVEATRRYYKTQPLADEDDARIENYRRVAARGAENPEIAAMLDLGIDPLRIGCVSYMYAPGDAAALYDCIALAVGGILRYNAPDWPPMTAVQYKGIHLGINRDGPTYPFDGPVPGRAIQLNYLITLPWLLPGHPDDGWA